MPAPSPTTPLDGLPRAPASDVKKLGWRGVMKLVARHGPVVVTNHNAPEAVILPAEEYERLAQAASQSSSLVLGELRAKYDARLQSLDASDAGDKLRDILRKPLELDGKVIAGEDF
ncbi:MAG TPA: type II toxin-antitoxin system prevent-host-death family antitoxin [Luteimonas sp.]|nr:type II toxin-antitoxin system prevent-host-death family antitoxin [Luteimonas sp.]HRO27580.1 type II toxin-antitoxin system prevent-host-death family antitoxin [Luteimonas sp.]HRP72770.1 type II toxin-antitoxin system prevent-host-death family antitoxin [Luteimonas sp.]